MSAATVAPSPSPPMPRKLAFVPRPATDGAARRLPAPEALLFPLAPIAADREHPTAQELDEVIAALAREHGHASVQVEGALFAVLPVSPQDDHIRPDGAVGPVLQLAVRRDRRHGTFRARAHVTLAYGYGASIGEAFRDWMDDFLYRRRLLLTEHDRLAPGMQQELTELERWQAGSAASGIR